MKGAGVTIHCIVESRSLEWRGPLPGHGSEQAVICKSCGLDNQSRFAAEIAIHFPGLENIDKPVVLVFPEVFVCLNCGNAEFLVPDSELRALSKGAAAAG